MREDLLHFVWKYRKLQSRPLRTTENETIGIIEPGTPNRYSGPDFFNARIVIAGQEWAGNIEIHVKSSHWYIHHHEQDPKYDNVILHVVWEDDVAVFRKDNSLLPTLELNRYVTKEVLEGYRQLFSKRSNKFINCEQDLPDTDQFLFANWLERMYFDRLEQKTKLVRHLLEETNNDWERVLFILLLKNFGLNVNGDAFLSLGKALDYGIVRKICTNRHQLESILYGMAGLLNHTTNPDSYYEEVREEYEFLKHKFKLDNAAVQSPEFAKLRPSNFPTIRLSQLAGVYARYRNLFGMIINASRLDDLLELFKVKASGYWDTHYTFGKISGKSQKKISIKFIHLIVINTLLPLKYCFAREHDRDANNELIEIISSLNAEHNAIVDRYRSLGVSLKNAMTTQALLQLYREFCTKDRCLQCAVGVQLLNGK